MRRIAIVLLAAASLAACRATAPVAVPVPVVASATDAVRPADVNLNAVLWMQRSAEYAAVSRGLYAAAADQLDAALADPGWDALVPAERGNPARGLPPAVIMDVDETVLDNSPYQARLIVDDAQYDEATWAQWVLEQRARAVPGAVEFARAAAQRGVTIVYLSNRAEALQAATLANLRAVGMPVADDSVFLGLGTRVDGCEQHGSGKACRRRLAGQRYRVLLQVGDQLGDFVGIGTNTPAAHAQLLATHADWFGRRWWMLPNPSYGSWEPAVFGNDWGQPRAARRQAKRAALDTARGH